MSADITLSQQAAYAVRDALPTSGASCRVNATPYRAAQLAMATDVRGMTIARRIEEGDVAVAAVVVMAPQVRALAEFVRDLADAGCSSGWGCENAEVSDWCDECTAAQLLEQLGLRHAS